MNGTLIIFYILAFVIFASGVFLLIAKKNSHVAVALVLNFIGIAGLFVLLSAGIAAVFQMLGYAGGVGLLVWRAVSHIKSQDPSETSSGRLRYLVSAIGTIVFLGILFYGISDLSLAGGSGLYEQVSGKVETGLDTYFIPLILMFFILFAAFIGAGLFVKRDSEKELNDDE